MKKLVVFLSALALLVGVFYTIFFSKGKVGISSNVNGAYIYIDGEKKAVIVEGYTDMDVEGGDRLIRVERISDDGEWRYFGEKKVFVKKNTYTKVYINTRKYLNKNDKNQKAWNALAKTLNTSQDRRYYRSSKGVVYDKKTQLLWQDDEDAKKVKKSWNDANSYCSLLNLLGFSDWRLPSQKELKSIVDFSRYNLTIRKAFKNVKSDWYWSSTDSESDIGRALSVHFNSGDDYWYGKSTAYSVRCVR